MSINKKIFVGAFVAVFAFAFTSANAAYMHSVTLKHGSAGAQVMALQQTLNATSCKVAASGAGSPGMETMNFGSLTKAAVMCFQAANGLTADGVVGPMTGAKLGLVVAGPAGNPNQPGCPAGAAYNSMTGAPCTGNTGGNNDGTQGTIDDVNELSQYNNEEVSENDEDAKIAGFEIEASNDGDIDIISMKITFDPTGNTGSDDLDDYLESVSIWQGDDEVGSADADDFSQASDDTWSKIITLSGASVDSDDTSEFFIAVNTVGNIDSGDISGDSWTVDLTNVRFRDGSGVVTTEDTTGDIGDLDVGFDFVSFSAAADTELKISTDSDSPDAQVVMVEDDEDTDDVVLLKGKLKLEGDSDVVIDEFPVTLTTVGGANVAAVANSLTLTIDGEEYTETVSITGATTGTVTFDDLNLTIEGEDTVEFTVMADINDIDAGNFDEGDTLTASVTSTNRDYIDAENEEGDQLSDSTEKSGTATGEAQEFRSSGVQLTLVSTDTDVAAGNSTSDDLGTFKIRFKVAANGDNVYVSSLADAVANSTTTTGKTSVQVDRAGTATAGGTSVTLVNVTDTDLNAAGLYEIEDGQEETFEITVTAQLPTAGSAGQFRASLIGLSWDTDSTDPTPDNAYTSNLDQFKTSYLALN